MLVHLSVQTEQNYGRPLVATESALVKLLFTECAGFSSSLLKFLSFIISLYHSVISLKMLFDYLLTFGVLSHRHCWKQNTKFCFSPRYPVTTGGGSITMSQTNNPKNSNATSVFITSTWTSRMAKGSISYFSVSGTCGDNWRKQNIESFSPFNSSLAVSPQLPVKLSL